MGIRIRDHIRSNVVGYIAIFLFAMSGTALALDGSNTVFSDDIVNGEVKTADIGTGQVASGDIATGGVGTADIADDAINQTKILEGGVRTSEIGNSNVFGVDIKNGEVGSADITDQSVTGADLAGTGVGDNGFNGDEEIKDGTISGFDIANDQIGGNHIIDGSLTAGDTSNVFDAGYGSNTACADDDEDGEVCASTTFELHQPGVLLVNATGEWVNASGPGDGVRMVCVLQVDGSDIGLAQSIGEAAANHPSPDNGTMALTALSPQLAAGTHTAHTLCAQLNADIDLNANQITAVRVDL
jgi:hypothetical protein